MWVIPMREYNEDPVFTSLVSPTTFAARRRTIYVFYDGCGRDNVRTANSELRNATSPGSNSQSAARSLQTCLQRIALGGSSQGGVFEARRSTKRVEADVAGRQAELWGDQQWQVLREVVEERNPRVIAIDVSSDFAFSDGLSAGELAGMSKALGPRWTSRFRHAEALPLELIATRLPAEEESWRPMQTLVWRIIGEAFSSRVITPGVTRTDDVVWWMRQRVNDLGLGTWFQPSVDVQRRGMTAEQLGTNPIIQRGDVLHCDFGITAMRLNTDTQHMAYVPLGGETEAPAGLRRALAAGNRLQDIVMSEIRPGRTGNEILASSLARMRAAGIDGTVYTHPIGVHGHGAGPLIGLWDYQEGVPGRGDARVIPNMWFSIELQATSPVPEWGGQRVRMALEEDAVVGGDGVVRWAHRQQKELHLVR
jgi:Xaa-Pro aminopeptidase